MSENFKIRIPESAIVELDAVEAMDWVDGVGLQDLIEWINQVVERFRPDSVTEQTRSSAAFTSRSFRHYQTLGCIDAPTRAGKSVVYSFKHYLQGLVIRKLLWEKVPSEQIAKLMAGKNAAQLKRLLFEGIEIVTAGGEAKKDACDVEAGTWERIVLAPGVELHLESSRSRLDESHRELIIERMRRLL